jgi:hypothetical protein
LEDLVLGKESGAFIIQVNVIFDVSTQCQVIPDDVDVKAMVEEVLEETGFREQRAAKMSVDDLLKYDSRSRTFRLSDI